MLSAVVPQSAPGASEVLPVLQKFDALRREILSVLDDGLAAAQTLGARIELVNKDFTGARNSVDASRLNLVVIGAEGHGKSTLIHAILGDELSPREKNEPGTVAPVYIEGANVCAVGVSRRGPGPGRAGRGPLPRPGGVFLVHPPGREPREQELSFTHISLLTEVLTVIKLAAIFHNTVHFFEL